MSESSNVSRRRFLRTSVGAASAVLIGSTQLQAGQTKPAEQPKDDLRCGMIGTGGRGHALLQAIHRSTGVRVAALCDTNPKNLNNAAAKVAEDKPQLFKDYHKLLDRKDLDAVFVATPPYLHKEMAIAVVKSGHHCYCEKPLALTVPDLDEVVRVVKASGKVFQVGTQLRYAPPWTKAIQAIHEGLIGPPVFVRAHRHNKTDLPHSVGWYFSRKLSGDTILEQAVHEFDLINWVFQGIPERAAGFGGQSVKFEPPGRVFLDHFTLSVDYGQDKKMGYSHSWISAGHPHDLRQEVVYGPKGSIDLEKGIFYPKKEEGVPINLNPEGKRPLANKRAVDAFFACVREGKEPLASVEAGRNAALVALLGRTAIDKGQVVTMKELLAGKA